MTAIEAIDRAQLCRLGLDPARALAHGIKLGRDQPTALNGAENRTGSTHFPHPTHLSSDVSRAQSPARLSSRLSGAAAYSSGSIE